MHKTKFDVRRSAGRRSNPPTGEDNVEPALCRLAVAHCGWLIGVRVSKNMEAAVAYIEFADGGQALALVWARLCAHTRL